jgi:hypothetical protein
LNIAREFEVSARKCGLFDQMASEVRQNRGFITDRRSTWVWKQIAPVTIRFNDFIDHAGNVVPTSTGIGIQSLNGSSINVFSQIDDANPMEMLTENSLKFERRYLTDWLHGLQFTVRSNADYLCGITGNMESNSILGYIIESLKV